MEITNSNRIIINEIMYSLSIATTSFHGDDSITAQLLHCFQSYLFHRITPTNTIILHIHFLFKYLLYSVINAYSIFSVSVYSYSFCSPLHFLKTVSLNDSLSPSFGLKVFISSLVA